jgi:hypothetical protein
MKNVLIGDDPSLGRYVGNEYVFSNGTHVRIVGVVGNSLRVKNLKAGHTSVYTKREWKEFTGKLLKEHVSTSIGRL